MSILNRDFASKNMLTAATTEEGTSYATRTSTASEGGAATTTRTKTTANVAPESSQTAGVNSGDGGGSGANGNNNGKYKVAIVGAGASGLTAARQALSYGIFETCVFEASTHIGGLWRYKPEETEEASVMKSTVINTSKEMTAYSEFPPPPHFANFMHNRRMLQYLELYANHFHLIDCIRFRHRVFDIQRHPGEYHSHGRWLVCYEIEHGEIETKSQGTSERDSPSKSIGKEVFDAVLLCTGHHTKPHWPEAWPGQLDTYSGRITHAHSYKDSRGYEDRVVAVVGVGNSGVDIAVELSRVAEQVYLVSRRGTWVLHRNLDHSVPFDLVLNTRLMGWFSSRLPAWLAAKFPQRIVEKRLDHEKYGLRPRHHVLAAHLTVNDELANRLSCGTIIVKPQIFSFTHQGLRFDDGSEVERVDEVILSTGYSFEFPLVEEGRLIPVVENQVSLYLYMFPPECADWNSMAVIGLIQPLGSIMPISEMQARLFFEAFIAKRQRGSSLLPTCEKMHRDISARHEQMHRRYVESRRHTIQVDYTAYMDELAAVVGCRPRWWYHVLMGGDPRLGWRLLVGANAPYAYRLEGPQAWGGARSAILQLQERVEAGMRGGAKRPPLLHSSIGGVVVENEGGGGIWRGGGGKLAHLLGSKLAVGQRLGTAGMVGLALVSIVLMYFLLVRLSN